MSLYDNDDAAEQEAFAYEDTQHPCTLAEHIDAKSSAVPCICELAKPGPRLMDVAGGDLERDGGDYRYGPPPWLGWAILIIVSLVVLTVLGAAVVWLTRAADRVGPIQPLLGQ